MPFRFHLLEKDMPVKCKELQKNQHFTQPPARYTEATLIKALEENGIGRPSTFMPIISTITSHEYVEREGKFLKPTLTVVFAWVLVLQIVTLKLSTAR